jgi:hypothetical protein
LYQKCDEHRNQICQPIAISGLSKPKAHHCHLVQASRFDLLCEFVQAFVVLFGQFFHLVELELHAYQSLLMLGALRLALVGLTHGMGVQLLQLLNEALAVDLVTHELTRLQLLAMALAVVGEHE